MKLKLTIFILLLTVCSVYSIDVCGDTVLPLTTCNVVTPVINCTNYLYNLTDVSTGNLTITNGTMTQIGTTSAYNFSFNQPAGSYLIVLCDGTMGTITATSSASTGYIDITGFSTPTSRYCSNNNTLLEIYEYTKNGTSYVNSVPYTCNRGCTNSTSPPSCYASSSMNIWFFIIFIALALFLTFIVPSKIVNIIGSILMVLCGIYVIVAGIDFTFSLSHIGTASSITISNQLTLALGFILIGLALFRIIVSVTEMSRK